MTSMARDTYFDATPSGSGTATGSTPSAPRTGTRGSQYTENNSPNANHGASPAPDRAARFNELGYDQSSKTPGAAR